MRIRTRFAPSPTGSLHIGNLRTALYAYAFAKGQGGDFLLRIEDTDQRRYVAESVEGIYHLLKIFGINWDEGPVVGGPHAPYVQTERTKAGLYQKYVDKLLDQNHAYFCFCPPETLDQIKSSQDKKEIKLRDSCRSLPPAEAQKKVTAGGKAAVRLRVPDSGKVSFTDFVLKKEISWDTRHVDEVMLLKSDGLPTYHLAAMIDDYEMKISHIFRGRDWLPSTPAHLLLFKYLDLPRPEIGHLTDILDPAGGKLSKRRGSTSCDGLLIEGFLPEAISNFIMLLGWAPKDNRELFTLKEFVREFSKGQIHVANPVFNRRKLVWFNGVYIRAKSDEELADYLIRPPLGGSFVPEKLDRESVLKTIPPVKERLRTLGEYSEMVEFLVKKIAPDPENLVPKGRTSEETKIVLAALSLKLSAVSENGWQAPKLEKLVRDYRAGELPAWLPGELFMTLRVAVTGKTVTPPLFESMALLGREKTLARIRTAAKKL